MKEKEFTGYDDFSIIDRVEIGDRVKVRVFEGPGNGRKEDTGTVTKILNGVWMQTGEESMDQVYVIYVDCDNTSNRPIPFHPKNVKPIDE